MIVSNKWTLNSLDVKIGFVQGKVIERTVSVRPQKEASPNLVWILKKCIHRLADVRRFWYLKLKEEFIKLGALPSTLDKGIFTWTIEHKAIGIALCFVDDVLCGGNKEFP